MKYVVAVYLEDRCWGGPEEGGWWYDAGEHVRTMRVFNDVDKACIYTNRLNRLLDKTLNKDRRELSSVLSDGRYCALIHDNFAPARYPEQRPHYE